MENTLDSDLNHNHSSVDGSVVVKSKSSIDIELHDRRYSARWAQPGTVERLRVNVRVETGSNGSTKSHVETLDLYSSHSRRVFAAKAAKIFGASTDAIESDLSEVLMTIDRIQRENVSSVVAAVQQAAPAYVMSEAAQKEALEFLKSENLMDRIANDMNTLGYVGEDTNKRLSYRIAISRKLANPLSAIIISQSGAGKSGLASMLESLVPPEDVVFWSRLTPQALYYVEKDFLKRKLVVIEERDGSDAADYSIRALQSKHKLVQSVPIKDPATGNIRTRSMEVEGPAAFLETTTKLQINPENATRCFEIYLDESPAQTERIQEIQRHAKTPMGLDLRIQSKYIEHIHHNAQRLLEDVPVGIPYGDLLTFPSSWLRTRRDQVRFLNLLEAVTFLYQKQREYKQTPLGNTYIEATVLDYAIVYALAKEVLDSGLDELKKPVRELLSLVEQKVRELATKRSIQPHVVTFAQSDVRNWSGLPHHQVKLALRELVEFEYFEVMRADKGMHYSYKLAYDLEKKRQPLAGLLTPVELYNRIQAQKDAQNPTQNSSQISKGVGKVGKPLDKFFPTHVSK